MASPVFRVRRRKCRSAALSGLSGVGREADARLFLDSPRTGHHPTVLTRQWRRSLRHSAPVHGRRAAAGR